MNKKIRKILLKKNKSKIVSLTAYSKNIAMILDNYCDLILVGDSMANVLYGHKNTHKISLKNINEVYIIVKQLSCNCSLIKLKVILFNNKFLVKLRRD